MNVRHITAAGIILAAVGIAAPANAAEARVPSTTAIRLMPGHGYQFHEGDPIRVCAMTATPKDVDRPVHLVLEDRNPRRGWKVIANLVTGVNRMACLYGVIHNTASGDAQLRARTIQNPDVARSTSRIITLDVTR